MASGTGANEGVAGASRRALIAGLVAGAAIGSAVGLAWSGPPAAVTQPVAFDHRLHVHELEIACATCHAFDAPAPFSGLPETETCASCHTEPFGTSPEEAKVVAAAESGSRSPGHRFSASRGTCSSRTVSTRRLPASRATSAIPRSRTRAPPPRAPPIRMSDCLRCHERAGAPTRCTACHR